MDNTEKKRRLGLSLAAGIAGGAVGFLCAVRHARWKREQRRAEAAEPTGEQNRPTAGDILLFHHARGENVFITLFTRSPFYHVAVYAGNGQVIEARPGGVVRSSLQGRENDFVVLPAPDGKGKEALVWAETQVGAGYDMTDTFVIILEHLFTNLHLNYTTSGKYTCGEFVAAAFAHAGANLFPDRDLDDVVPGDFARLLPAGIDCLT